MSKKVVEKTATGFNVKPDPIDVAKRDKAKNGATANERIEAKLDLIMEHLGIKL
jgi:hypothetical protein